MGWDGAVQARRHDTWQCASPKAGYAGSRSTCQARPTEAGLRRLLRTEYVQVWLHCSYITRWRDTAWCEQGCLSGWLVSAVMVRIQEYAGETQYVQSDLKACIGLWRCAWRVMFSFPGPGQSPGRSGASCKLSPNQSPQPAVFRPGIRGSLAWRSSISPAYLWVDCCGSDHRTILGILWVIEEACMCLYHGSLGRAMVRPKRGSWISGSDMRSGGICRFIY